MVILKTLANGSKIPLVPPLLANNEFVTDFLVKANLSNGFFREQCRPVTTDSSLPNNQVIETVTRLSNFNIDIDTVIKLIRSLNPNKDYGCNGISIRMLNLCTTSISKLLHVPFNKSVMHECFTNEWEKANIIPVYKKGDKKLIKKLATCAIPACL